MPFEKQVFLTFLDDIVILSVYILGSLEVEW